MDYEPEEQDITREDEMLEDEADELDTDDQVENAIAWIDALAHNDYAQCTEQLASGSRRCALGVAWNELGSPFEVDEWGGSVSKGPYLEAEHLGLGLGVYARIIIWNDEFHFTFPEIAKELLDDLDEYFVDEVATELKLHYWKRV